MPKFEKPSDEPKTYPGGLRGKIARFVESRVFQGAILTLILVNAFMLGLETMDFITLDQKTLLENIDIAFLLVFVIELILRVIAWGPKFLKNGWNVFDFTIIMISAIAFIPGATAFRVFRVLRVLHIISLLPKMRLVVSSLLEAIPGIASVGVVLVLIIYVFAVIAANLFGPAHEALFGDVFVSMYTLFQVLTLEGWAEIASAVATTHPHSWIFFISFVLVGTFTMLNLFVAIVVRVVEDDADDEMEAYIKSGQSAIRADVAALKAQLEELTAEIKRSK